MSKKLSIDQFRELINKGQATDPLVYLESVMQGQDPRGLSEIYVLANEINEWSDGAPDPDEWAELFNKIQKHAKFAIVSLSESTAAAKTLAEYVHAKRKSIENIDASATTKTEDLTEDEIRSFLEIYEGEF